MTHHNNNTKNKQVIAIDYIVDNNKIIQSYIAQRAGQKGVRVTCDLRKFDSGLIMQACATESEARKIIEKNILLFDTKAVKKRELVFRVQ